MDLVKILWKKWLAIARPIGNFQSQVILSLFFLLFLWPLAILFKISSPLKLGLKRRSNFEKWDYPKKSLEQAKKQY